jgi:hypothetical protein
MMYKINNLYIFRRRVLYYKPVIATFGADDKRQPELLKPIREVTALAEAHEPFIQAIEIC